MNITLNPNNQFTTVATLRKHPVVPFSCREYLAITSKTMPSEEKSALLYHALLTAPNSIMHQSEPQPKGTTLHDYRMSALRKLYSDTSHVRGSELQSHERYVMSGALAGCGLAWAKPKNGKQGIFQTVRSPFPAFKAISGFTGAVGRAMIDEPTVILAHIRAADRTQQRFDVRDTHPFAIEEHDFFGNGQKIGIALSHHGQVNPQYCKQQIVRIAKEVTSEVAIIQPKGKTDSELLFCLLLNRWQQYRATKENPTIDDFAQLFANTLHELSNKGVFVAHTYHRTKSSSSLPTLNVLMMVGSYALVYSNDHAENGLWIGKNHSGGYIAISSEPILTDSSDTNNQMSWSALPTGKAFLFTSGKDNISTPKVFSPSMATPGRIRRNLVA